MKNAIQLARIAVAARKHKRFDVGMDTKFSDRDLACLIGTLRYENNVTVRNIDKALGWNQDELPSMRHMHGDVAYAEAFASYFDVSEREAYRILGCHLGRHTNSAPNAMHGECTGAEYFRAITQVMRNHGKLGVLTKLVARQQEKLAQA